MLIATDDDRCGWKFAVSRTGFLSFGDYDYGGILDVAADWILRVEAAELDWDEDRDIVCRAIQTVLRRVCRAEVPRQVGFVLTNGIDPSLGVFFADIDDPSENSRDLVIEMHIQASSAGIVTMGIWTSDDSSRKHMRVNDDTELAVLDAWVAAEINPRIG